MCSGREVCQVEATGPNLQGCAGSAATAAWTMVCGVVWWSWLSRAVRRTATQVGLLIGGLVPGGLRSKSLKLPAAAGAQVLSWRSFDAAAVMADEIGQDRQRADGADGESREPRAPSLRRGPEGGKHGFFQAIVE